MADAETDAEDGGKVKMTAVDVEVALRAHFASPTYAFITNVRNGHAWSATRTCDALAIGTWQSAGLYVHGIEIKVARSDWLREIQDPNKAEAFAKHTDYWWIAAPSGVLRLEEMPANWGHLEPTGKKVRVRRPATRRENPEPISRSFLAAIARRVTEQSPAEEAMQALRRKVEEEWRTAFASERKKDSAAAASMRDLIESAEMYKRSHDAVGKFHELTGRHLSDFTVDGLAGDIKEFLAHKDALENARRRLGMMAETSRKITELCAKTLEHQDG